MIRQGWVGECMLKAWMRRREGGGWVGSSGGEGGGLFRRGKVREGRGECRLSGRGGGVRELWPVVRLWLCMVCLGGLWIGHVGRLVRFEEGGWGWRRLGNGGDGSVGHGERVGGRGGRTSATMWWAE